MVVSKRRSVFVTGGTGSVGRALVESFSKSGYAVTFQYYRDEAVANRLRDQFDSIPLRVNFEESFSLPPARFDVVVNNAGINISDVLTHELGIEDWERTIRVNLTGAFLVAKSCLPWMIEKQWGRIINISSIYGLRGVETNCPYTVSKHGMSGLTKTIAKEYASFGITCNEICPGPIDSDLLRDIAKRSTREPGESTAYLAEVAAEVPAKRLAKGEEIAATALFLASDEAGYINGASVPIDGGLIA